MVIVYASVIDLILHMLHGHSSLIVGLHLHKTHLYSTFLVRFYIGLIFGLHSHKAHFIFKEVLYKLHDHSKVQYLICIHTKYI